MLSHLRGRKPDCVVTSSSRANASYRSSCKPITIAEPIGRSLACDDCGKDLRSCRNCRFFLPKQNGCSESQAENPSDRERANFCDWFGLNPKYRETTAGEKNNRDAADSAKKKFDSLFN